MHVDARALRHVVTLADTLNYTKAAEVLHLSQSALSRSIQATEQRSNLRIFDRGRGGVHLTPMGKSFVERARSLLREVAAFDRQVQSLAGGEDYEVAFGLAPLPAKSLLLSLGTDLLDTGSNRRWRVEINRAPELLKLLQEEQIEFFLCAEEQISSSLPVKAEPLAEFPLSFVVRKGHPLVTKSQGTERYPVVSVAPIHNYESFPESLASRLEYPPRLVANDYVLVSTIVQSTDAVWPTSSFAVSDELASGELVRIPISARQVRETFNIVAYSLHKRTPSPGALELQRHFRSTILGIQENAS